MKVQRLIFILVTILLLLANSLKTTAQQYKMRQSTSMTGMQSETTIYVKGMRKRTEGGGYMGVGANLVTIEQCDLQRTVKFNTKKKLYIIEPFATETEEGNEDVKPAAVKTSPTKQAGKTQKGGIIYTTYNITDTGERKKMYGLNARHVWTTQKIKPSADACMMKDSMLIRTDGWYIDLPQFNCPTTGYGQSMRTGGYQQPDCKDRFVSKRTGKGKLGFPLLETRTMIMGNGRGQTSEFTTSLETLEFTTAKIDSMLFEIPLGYTLAASEEDLQDNPMDIQQLINESTGNNRRAGEKPVISEEKKSGSTRIGVYVPKGEESLALSELQEQLVSLLNDGSVEAVAINSEADARKYNCDLLLNTEFTKVKQGSKVGSFLKAIKNSDPGAGSSFTIEANLVLTKLADGSGVAEKKVNGKYDGKVNEAAMKALEKGTGSLMKDL